jgi:hypothetical protein
MMIPRLLGAGPPGERCSGAQASLARIVCARSAKTQDISCGPHRPCARSRSQRHTGGTYSPATRLAADASGVLTGENTILTGGGSQQPNLSRWGDYSAMSIDPTDDCTFWYTNEYLKSNGAFNWSTRIASFKVAGCQ